jgi:competence protein ComEC
MRHPLVPVAICYGGGIILGHVLEGLVYWPGLLVVAWLGALVYVAWVGIRPFLLSPVFVLAGATHYTLQTAVISPYDLRALLGGEPICARLMGVLETAPQRRVQQHGDQERNRSTAQLLVRRLCREGQFWEPAHGRVFVSTPGVLSPAFFSGQEVEVTGVLQAPERPVAEGLFDYRAFLGAQGIYYLLRVSSTNDWRLVPGAAPRSPPIHERFSTWAAAQLAQGLPEEDLALRLLWDMSLGWRTALNGEVAEPFMQSGTMHIFAISGFHVALIGWSLIGLLQVCRLPRALCGCVVIPVLWFYAAATGWPASGVRSSIMMTVLILGWSLNRPGDLLNSLAAAALLILIWDPQQLFQIGFQLSFFVVLSLILFGPCLRELQAKLLQPDPFLPDRLRPAWQQRLAGPLRYLTGSLGSSLAAWVGSLPLVAYYFHYLNPVAILANLVVLPLGALALTSCMASLLVGAWWVGLAELFNHSGWFWMYAMIRASEWAAEIPWGWWYVPAPSLPGLILYYGLMIGTLVGGWRKPGWRRVMVWGGVGLALIVCFQWLQGRNEFRLVVLPLNGGDGGVLTGPNCGGAVLIDGGNLNASETVTIPYLKARGINRLSSLLLTHGDVRHVGGAESIALHFRVGRVYASSVPFRSLAYRRLLEALAVSGRLQTVRPGGRAGLWRVLYPGLEDNFSRADDKPMVLLGEFYGTRVLWISDLSAAGQNALLNRHPDLRAEVVISGLPVKSQPLSDGFLEMVQPKIVVVVDANYPAYEQASMQVRQRLARYPGEVIYTREAGAVTLVLKKNGWKVFRTNEGEVLPSRLDQ